MIFVFIYFFLSNYPELIKSLHDEAPGELHFVSVIYRHGDRAPTGFYPEDPHRDVSHWPNGWGQLTELGKHQQCELGKWIRHRYWDFLPKRYNASDIYVRSTDVDRTLMSAYCNLAGLYDCQRDDYGLTWQPVPVHTVPVDMDHVLAAHKPCSTYECLLRDLFKSEEVKSFNEHYAETFCNLSEHSGLKIDTVQDCVFLYSTLNIQNLHGFRLPCWAKNYFPEPLKDMTEFAFKLPCFTAPLKRLKCGPLIKDIVDHMEQKQKGKIDQKMWMYSAHDTTLANLMQCLDVYDGVIPPYTATVIFELYKADSDYYVVVSYKTPTTFRVLRLPSCDRVCCFESFKNTLRSVIPCHWEDECKRM